MNYEIELGVVISPRRMLGTLDGPVDVREETRHDLGDLFQADRLVGPFSTPHFVVETFYFPISRGQVRDGVSGRF